MTKPERHLILMAKAPKLGQVKTRLAAGIGGPGATKFYRHLQSRLIHQLSRDPRWQATLALTPDIACNAPPLPHYSAIEISVIPQGSGSLGKRMQSLFEAFAPTPTLIIGTDIPAITNNEIAAAFKTLAKYQVIFGPSGDGGYWCVGQQNRPRSLNLFENVRWSGPHALKDSLKGTKGSIGLTGELKDVDTIEDLNRVKPEHLNRWVITPR